MAKFYFMDQEFSGTYFDKLGAVSEKGNIELELELGYSWGWFYDYFFVPACEGWGSDESATLRSHLLNMAASLYKYHDPILSETGLQDAAMQETIEDLLGMVEASKSHYVSFWTYGESKEDLNEERASLPSDDQMKRVLELPHLTRMRSDLPDYLYPDEKAALKRYRNELADFNRRKKLAQKNQQRDATA